MPLLFSLGQHSGLEAVANRLQADDIFIAFSDDVYVVNARPDNVLHSHRALEEELWTHACIRINGGKTQVWNHSGSRPHGCDILQRVAVQADPDTVVWRGSDVPTVHQGIKILGTPLRHHDIVQNHLERVADEHQRFLDMLRSVPNLQSSWLLLLDCASARANCLLRTMCPDSVRGFAEAHDRGLWECVHTSLNILATKTSRHGTQQPFHCPGSCRHDHQRVGGVSCDSVSASVGGFEPPIWISLANGTRSHTCQPEDYEPGGVRQGWQHDAATRIERVFGMTC